MNEVPTISIKAEPVFNFFGFSITNSLLTAAIVFFLFLGVAFYYRQQINASKRSGFFYFLHFIFQSIYSLFQSVLGKHTETFFPLMLAFFLYIMIHNWFGLLPGVGSILINIGHNHKEMLVPILRGNNADLNTTLALALISVGLIQFYSVKFLGIKVYLNKFFNFSHPINFFVGILDIVSEISKVISFAFRLFGNIFAGEVLLTIVAFLVPVLASFPFIVLEVFVGFVQALVFSMLTAVFLMGAIERHE